jgi:hypothetical protein
MEEGLVSERKQRPHGETWEKMRRLYLKYPLVPVTDFAEMLGITRARAHACVTDLKDERERLRRQALDSMKRAEKL